ncbi:MAG TPA: S-layer homology domain-containing protein [Chloroflexia bacterium]
MLMSVAMLPQWASAGPNPHTQPVGFDKITQVIPVTTNSDVLDAAGGVCADVIIASLPGLDGVTSLREAMCAANNNSGPDTINFGIPGGGVHTITLLSDLPESTGPVTIDGYSQPEASCNTLSNATNAQLKIVLVGSDLLSSTGLALAGGSSTVKGLVFQNFASGISVQSADNTITGNFIGADSAGAVASPNVYGIKITAANNTVGGIGLCDRNLISGNQDGVVLYTSAANNNTISNNLIGTNAAATAAIRNTNSGVFIRDAANNTVGGTSTRSGNLISGNDSGVLIWPSVGPNWIQGNWIGVGATHTAPLGNVVGVWLVGADNTMVGGVGGAPEANVIAYSQENVIVSGNNGNNIRANSIYGSQSGQGIDLAGDFVTPNDTNDTDSGANFLQNFPVLTSATGSTIEGTLNSTDDTTFAIEFFASASCSSSGHGEGQMYLGSRTVTTVNNNADITFTGATPPAGWFITATATDLSNNSTSEFSQCFSPEYLPGEISGRAYLLNSSGQVAVGASAYACARNGSYCSPTVLTNNDGDYLLPDLPGGVYDVYASPPSSNSNLLTDRLTGIVVNDGTVAGQDLMFPAPLLPPPGVSIQPNYGNPNGVPVVSFLDVFTLSANGCRGGSATYEISQDGQVVGGEEMPPNPSGTYTAEIGPLYPLHGLVEITIVTHCPDGSTRTVRIHLYIDPSGVVQSFLPNGTPAALPLATVTLYRSDDPAGPFDVVPDGSALMSPSNRKNADITHLSGHFGWDVVPGFYKVRANKAGCTKPGDPGQPYVDSYIMEIPPPVTDLDLRLDCGSPTFTDVHDGDYFYNAATYLAAIGVLSGYGNTSQCPTGVPCFLPSNNVTRGQAAKIIANSVGLADVIPDTQQTFQDVDPTTNNTFWLYIERMAQRGYVSGYPCVPGVDCVLPGNKPYFRWGNSITRNQLAKMLVKANQYASIYPASAHFQDVPADNDFYAYVETAYDKGLIGGYLCVPGVDCMPGNKPYFRGGANATRGQLAKMVTQTLLSPTP